MIVARSAAENIPPRPPPRAAPRADGTLQLDQKSFQFLNNAWVRFIWIGLLSSANQGSVKL